MCVTLHEFNVYVGVSYIMDTTVLVQGRSSLAQMTLHTHRSVRKNMRCCENGGAQTCQFPLSAIVASIVLVDYGRPFVSLCCLWRWNFSCRHPRAASSYLCACVVVEMRPYNSDGSNLVSSVTCDHFEQQLPSKGTLEVLQMHSVVQQGELWSTCPCYVASFHTCGRVFVDA